MKRRDLMDAAKLLARHKMDQTNMAALMLATQYLQARRDGETVPPFGEWLDQEISDDDEDDDGDDPHRVIEAADGQLEDEADPPTT